MADQIHDRDCVHGQRPHADGCYDPDLMHALDEAEAVVMAGDCEHHWAASHEPGHIVYWVRTCMICHRVHWDDLDAEIRAAVAGLLLAAGSTASGTKRKD